MLYFDLDLGTIPALYSSTVSWSAPDNWVLSTPMQSFSPRKAEFWAWNYLDLQGNVLLLIFFSHWTDTKLY